MLAAWLVLPLASSVEKAVVLRLLNDNRNRLRQRQLNANEIAFNPFTRLASLPADATPNDIAAWTVVSRVLLNLDETLTKD